MALYRSILVPTDGSPLSTRAVKEAVRIARAAKAKVVVLHAIAPFSTPAYSEAIIAYPELYSRADYEKSTRKHAAKLLAKGVALARAAGVRAEAVALFHGYPWQAIIRTARGKKCDLIVMASHGRRGIAGVLLGSETAKVLAHSKTPVLVCR